MSVQEQLFPQPPLSPRRKCQPDERPVEIKIVDIRPIKHWRKTYWIRANVEIGGLVIHDVIASTAGVVWPTRYEEPVVTFTDPQFQQAAEDRLRDEAGTVNQRGNQ